MKDKNLKYLLFGGLLVYFFTRRSQPVYTHYPQVPPAPPRNNQQAWVNWVGSIIDVYGAVATLWEPGGPFYQEQLSPEEVQQILMGFSNWQPG